MLFSSLLFFARGALNLCTTASSVSVKAHSHCARRRAYIVRVRFDDCPIPRWRDATAAPTLCMTVRTAAQRALWGQYSRCREPWFIFWNRPTATGNGAFWRLSQSGESAPTPACNSAPHPTVVCRLLFRSFASSSCWSRRVAFALTQCACAEPWTGNALDWRVSNYDVMTAIRIECHVTLPSGRKTMSQRVTKQRHSQFVSCTESHYLTRLLDASFASAPVYFSSSYCQMRSHFFPIARETQMRCVVCFFSCNTSCYCARFYIKCFRICVYLHKSHLYSRIVQL